MTTIERRRGELHTRYAAAYRNVALFLLFMFAALSAPAAEQRVALVIGNSKYPSAALRNSVNDATSMAKKLREMGFEVVLRTDVNQRQMTRAISEFGDKLTLGAVGLFYYAGHGMQARGKNYLVPVDAEITTESSVSTESVDVERVLDQLTPARLAMVILDACRNNPFERRFRSGAGRGLAQIDAPAGTLIAYATAPGKVARDGEGAHGTYTEALLQAIETPGLRVEDVFKQVRINVLKATGNQQIPWESSSLTGDFLFRPAKAVAAQPAPTRVDQEALALREQMALLSAEITKLREARPAPSAIPSRNEQDQKKTDQDSAVVREQLALLSAEISKLRESRPPRGPDPVQNAQEQKKVDQEAAAARDQLALLNAEIAKLRADSTAPRAPTAEERAAWKKRIVKLEPLRGKLNLASAMLTLLDSTSDADASKLRAFESEVSRRPYSVAVALGVDASGLLVWGGSHTQESGFHASEIAADFCAGAGGIKCKAVIVNGSFVEDGLFQVVNQLGSQSVEVVRAALISSLGQPLIESSAGTRRLRGGGSPMGYMVSRTASK